MQEAELLGSGAPPGEDGDHPLRGGDLVTVLDAAARGGGHPFVQVADVDRLLGGRGLANALSQAVVGEAHVAALRADDRLWQVERGVGDVRAWALDLVPHGVVDEAVVAGSEGGVWLALRVVRDLSDRRVMQQVSAIRVAVRSGAGGDLDKLRARQPIEIVIAEGLGRALPVVDAAFEVLAVVVQVSELLQHAATGVGPDGRDAVSLVVVGAGGGGHAGAHGFDLDAPHLVDLLQQPEQVACRGLVHREQMAVGVVLVLHREAAQARRAGVCGGLQASVGVVAEARHELLAADRERRLVQATDGVVPVRGLVPVRALDLGELALSVGSRVPAEQGHAIIVRAAHHAAERIMLQLDLSTERVARASLIAEAIVGEDRLAAIRIDAAAHTTVSIAFGRGFVAFGIGDVPQATEGTVGVGRGPIRIVTDLRRPTESVVPGDRGHVTGAGDRGAGALVRVGRLRPPGRDVTDHAARAVVEVGVTAGRGARWRGIRVRDALPGDVLAEGIEVDLLEDARHAGRGELDALLPPAHGAPQAVVLDLVPAAALLEGGELKAPLVVQRSATLDAAERVRGVGAIRPHLTREPAEAVADEAGEAALGVEASREQTHLVDVEPGHVLRRVALHGREQTLGVVPRAPFTHRAVRHPRPRGHDVAEGVAPVKQPDPGLRVVIGAAGHLCQHVSRDGIVPPSGFAALGHASGGAALREEPDLANEPSRIVVGDRAGDRQLLRSRRGGELREHVPEGVVVGDSTAREPQRDQVS
ncbi:Hypothetical protein CAP_8777 [Chondromyces apiculatus DSM 436]|uniref:Uncharacterized protein n=1 Tax=Chondromyces apiculatus DSM 436 TaxID=1192034 RepID=A0A017SWL7_9BACT|nr:Hypothetical protein CAP_8777 [Chondromyces apiculatus DSM 436]